MRFHDLSEHCISGSQISCICAKIFLELCGVLIGKIAVPTSFLERFFSLLGELTALLAAHACLLRGLPVLDSTGGNCVLCPESGFLAPELIRHRFMLRLLLLLCLLLDMLRLLFLLLLFRLYFLIHRFLRFRQCLINISVSHVQYLPFLSRFSLQKITLKCRTSIPEVKRMVKRRLNFD